ncbi:MAG TPA: hypothetical protein VEJ84_16665 [Acidimicrobiales bacterium]|nr:hypothetical protein [Acidimicrobiales bacterium]
MAEIGVAGGGRKPRLARAELRSMLLDAALEILREEGLHTGSVNITFKRVCDRILERTGIQVTNGSVIKRIWENQAEFQADVLVTVANDQSRPELGLIFNALGPLLEDADLSSAESRARLVQQVCRVGGEANAVATAESPNYPLWMHVVATAITTPHAQQRERILMALREGYTSFTKLWEESFAALAAHLGLRIRPESDMSQFVTVIVALDQGFSLRHRINGRIEYVTRPTGPNGENEDWTLFALGLEALVNQCFEPDPTYAFAPSA